MQVLFSESPLMFIGMASILANLISSFMHVDK